MEYNGYQIVTSPDARMKKIEAIGRGSVHLSLRGLYTSIKDAKKAIDFHIEQKGGKDG